MLDTYAPPKELISTNWNLSFNPWIILSLQKSISVQNKLLTNFINKKDPTLKEGFQVKYKKYRNLLSRLMKKSK